MSPRPHSSLWRKILSIMFYPGFWKRTQNKDLSYTDTFHPRYWIFLVSDSEFMALGLLFSRSSRTPSASLFPFENVISIRQAAALNRRSERARRGQQLRRAGASLALPRTGSWHTLPPEPLRYSEKACKEEQRTADFTPFAVLHIFQRFFWKGCELKG